MRKIIEGKVYDTETAKFLATFESNFAMNDFNWYEENLYIKKTGEYFIYGKGNGLSPYAKSVAGGSQMAGERIVPLTEEEARKWAEESLEADEYEKIFGEVTEDDDLSVRIKDARDKAGLTQAEMSEKLNIPKRTIENWESGVTVPPTYVAELVIKALK